MTGNRLLSTQHATSCTSWLNIAIMPKGDRHARTQCSIKDDNIWSGILKLKSFAMKYERLPKSNEDDCAGADSAFDPLDEGKLLSLVRECGPTTMRAQSRRPFCGIWNRRTAKARLRDISGKKFFLTKRVTFSLLRYKCEIYCITIKILKNEKVINGSGSCWFLCCL